MCDRISQREKEKCACNMSTSSFEKNTFFLPAWYLGQSTYLPPSKLIADVNVDYAYISTRLNQPEHLFSGIYVHKLRY